MRLLTSGVVFESVPETVTLPPDMVTSLTLSGWARESGELEITGKMFDICTYLFIYSI